VDVQYKRNVEVKMNNLKPMRYAVVRFWKDGYEGGETLDYFSTIDEADKYVKKELKKGSNQYHVDCGTITYQVMKFV
jgi:hypothetical protein